MNIHLIIRKKIQKKPFILLIGLLLLICLTGCKKQLSYQDENMIKQIYVDHCNKRREDSYKLKVEDITIKYYLGEYDDKHIAIIKGDGVRVDIFPFLGDSYYCLNKESLNKEKIEIYVFKYVPEMISVYYKNKYYTIIEAYEQGIMTNEEMRKIENDLNKIFNEIEE